MQHNPEHAVPRNDGEVALEVKNISKTFYTGARQVQALQQVGFHVRRGVVTGLVGPDAAGKTTLMRLAAGLLVADTGNITVLGMDAATQSLAVQGTIGYMPQRFGLYEDLTVQENLDLYADLQGVPEADRPARYAELMHMAGLVPFTKRLAGQLSGGMKQKLALAIALLGNPPILLLDEPTANLDLKSREDFLHLLSILKKDGKTIIFSSHRMEEVLSFADRVLVLDNGKLIADSSPLEIYRKFGKNGLLKIYIEHSASEDAIKTLTKMGFTSSMNGKGIKVKVDPDSKIEPIKVLLDSGFSIENFDYEVELF